MTKNRNLIVGTLALALALTAAASGVASVARGDTATLTFTRTVALPGVTLAPGAYVFEIFDSPGSIDIVRVSKKANMTHAFLGMTRQVERPANLRRGVSGVALGEARPGQPVPITVWYPADGSAGRKFAY